MSLSLSQSHASRSERPFEGILQVLVQLGALEAEEGGCAIGFRSTGGDVDIAS